VILHDSEEAHSLAIVVEIITGDNVRITPHTANGTDALIDLFVEARQHWNISTNAIVDIEHRVSVLIDSSLTSGNALAINAFTGVGIISVAVSVPSNAAITRPGAGVVPFPLAAFVLDGWVDHALGVPPVSLAQISGSAVTLASRRVIVAAAIVLLFVLQSTRLANTRGVVEFLRETNLAKSVGVALGSHTAITLIFALVVPRNTTLVIDMGIGHAGGVVCVL